MAERRSAAQQGGEEKEGRLTPLRPPGISVERGEEGVKEADWLS
jgi:hypothetical protein